MMLLPLIDDAFMACAAATDAKPTIRVAVRAHAALGAPADAKDAAESAGTTKIEVARFHICPSEIESSLSVGYDPSYTESHGPTYCASASCAFK